jgi:hypothetical protein
LIKNLKKLELFLLNDNKEITYEINKAEFSGFLNTVLLFLDIFKVLAR